LALKPCPGPASAPRTPAIAAGALFLVVPLLGASLVGCGGSNSATAKRLNATTAYYDRDGYDRKQIGNGIGDPAALKMQKSDAVISTGAVATIPACTIITTDDLKSAGLLLKANSYATVIDRAYFDGVGAGKLEYGQYSTPSFENSNHCRYALEGHLDSVSVDVYQPFIVSKNALDDDIKRRYAPAPAISGLAGVELFKRKNDSAGASQEDDEYYIRKGDVTLALRLTITADRQTKGEALIKVAVANLAKVQAAPQGTPTAGYDSPTFKGKYLQACTLMTNDDIKQLTGNDAQPLVSEGLASATGVSRYRSLGDETSYNYIENQCTRANGNRGIDTSTGSLLNLNQNLHIKATSFDAARGAQNSMAATTSTARGVVRVAGLGDEAIAFKDSANQNTLTFRKGRFIVELVFNRTNQKIGGLTDLQRMVDKLDPFAQKAADQIKD
jgi:hypothetical protein